jgi:hypothetical protein
VETLTPDGQPWGMPDNIDSESENLLDLLPPIGRSGIKRRIIDRDEVIQVSELRAISGLCSKLTNRWLELYGAPLPAILKDPASGAAAVNPGSIADSAGAALAPVGQQALPADPTNGKGKAGTGANVAGGGPVKTRWPNLEIWVSEDTEQIEYSISKTARHTNNRKDMKLSPDEFKTLCTLASMDGDWSKNGRALSDEKRRKCTRLNKKLCLFFQNMEGPAIDNGKTRFVVSRLKTREEVELERLQREQAFDNRNEEHLDSIADELKAQIQRRSAHVKPEKFCDFQEQDNED